jgi:kinesin family protein C1
MSSRLSLGGKATALRDVSSHQNSRSSSFSRRMSFSGDALNALRAETPKKDRHAMLDEWRRQSRTRDFSSSVGMPTDHDSSTITDGAGPTVPTGKRLRTRHPDGVPPLPPSNISAADSGLSALERIRQRKAEREKQQSIAFDAMNAHNSSICYDDSNDAPRIASSVGRTLLPGTPSGGNLFRGGASRRRSMSVQPIHRRTSILSTDSEFSFSQGSTGSNGFSQRSTGMSQDTIMSDPMPSSSSKGMDTVEDAVVQQLQQRVRDLERIKMDLSMEIAPLKARLRQKEDIYLKEQKKLLQEIEDLQEANQGANERNRDLQMQFENLKEECKKLQTEVRKASSTLHNNNHIDGASSGWNRQLQNDRDVAELKERLRSAEDEIDSIRLTKVSVEKELHGTKIELDSLYRSFDELQTEYELVSQSTSDNREAEMKLEHLTTEHIATSAQLNAVCADLAATKARAAATITAKEEEHKNEVEQLHFEMSVLKTRAGNTGGAGTEVSVDPDDEEDKAVLKARLEERDRRIAEMEVQLLSGEALRRQMHNRIQELRGNIRVFVRTRPFLPNDGASTASAIDVLPDGEALSILDTRSPTPYEFKFDKVFPPSSGQDTVFQEVADFVQSALDGYHVCLFSYGQTGSGKTHTMQGSGNGAMRGIIPRAVEQILQQAQVMQSQKWNFTVSASFLEIYNEDLKDLLVSMKGGKETSTNPPKLSIKRSREGKSFVDGLSEVKIDTREPATGMHQLEALMGVAARSRSVASTKMNSQSSRSHSVFMLNLHGYNEETGAEVSGALNLCDLAGSERLDRSGASSDAKRLRETQAINKSLSCLGDVFNALATGASHVPYRNSKLTYLLQDCLSGDGKALMFVNLSPTTASSNESLCSLRFAQRVNQVELGKPTKHIQYNR